MTQEVDEVEQQSHISVTMGGKESNLEIMLASELINGAKKHIHTRARFYTLTVPGHAISSVGFEGFKDPSLTAGQRHKVKPQFACFGALHLTGAVVHMCASECLLHASIFFLWSSAASASSKVTR